MSSSSLVRDKPSKTKHLEQLRLADIHSYALREVDAVYAPINSLAQ